MQCTCRAEQGKYSICSSFRGIAAKGGFGSGKLLEKKEGKLGTVYTTTWVPWTLTEHWPHVLYGGTTLTEISTGGVVAAMPGPLDPAYDSASSFGGLYSGFTVPLDSLVPNLEQDLTVVTDSIDADTVVAAIIDTMDGVLELKAVKFLVVVPDDVVTSEWKDDETGFVIHQVHRYARDTFTLRFTSDDDGATFALMDYDLDGSTGTSVIYLKGHYVTTVTYVPQTVVSNICSEEHYRYSFDGQMKTNEWAGVGNHTTALFWEYDTRTGRRLNIEPKFKKFPGISLYSTNGANPIRNKDEKGDELLAGVVGFVVGAGIALVQAASDNGGIANAFSKENRAKTIGHMINNGVAGAVVGLTNGASLLATSAIAGSGSSIVDDLIDNKGDVTKINIGKSLISGLAFTAGAGGGRVLGNVLKRSGNGALGNAVGDVLDNALGINAALLGWGATKIKKTTEGHAGGGSYQDGDPPGNYPDGPHY